eukprot:s4584_g3.t1
MGVALMATAYVIPCYLLLHFLLATQVTDLSVRQLLEAPLLWLFPSSRLVASSRPCAARAARLGSWVLRWAMVVVVEMVVMDGSFKKFYLDHMCYQDPSRSCQGLPPWLQTPIYETWWSGSSSTCMVDPKVYTTCLMELPWFTRGYCNYSGGECAINTFPQWLVDLVIAITFYVPWTGLCVSTLLILCRCCSKQLEEVPRTGAAAMNPGTGEAGWVKKTFYALMTVVPFFLDFLLDVNATVQFVLTGNYLFAGVSAGIFFLSLSQQVAHGAVQKLVSATCESLKLGQSTDDLEIIMLSEKAVESPLQLLLQFYAFPFVTASEFAVFSFILSLLLSLKSVAEATYWLAELKLHDALVKPEYESLA